LEPIVQPDLVENVYSRLRHAILAGNLGPGMRLVEDPLAARLGVSRAPVRDALRRLEADGLVVSQARRGKVVATLFAQDAWEVYSLRSALEVMAIRLAIARAPAGLAGDLDDIVRAMQEASHQHDLIALSSLDVRFHDAISQASGHSRLIKVLDGMHDQIRLLSLQVIDTLYANSEDIPARHMKLAEAIKAGDADAAEAAVRTHIDSVAHRVVSAMQEAERRSPQVARELDFAASPYAGSPSQL
jgi:DNA-binding GntR family transcriptional regulator